jgi:hypothetical protein
MLLGRDFHLHPLVIAKVAICKLGLAGVFDLIEFCHRCGRRVHEVWHGSDALWNAITGMGEGGVRCVRCFDRECRDRGVLLMWEPRVEHVFDSEGRRRRVLPPAPVLPKECAA